jgi:hypothetical protein
MLPPGGEGGMDDRHNDPIIIRPEPSGPGAWWRNLLSAIQALRARLPVKAPAPKSRKTAGRVPDAAETKAWREVHGPPVIWLAPVFLAFAAAYALPQLALFVEPDAPRGMIKAVIAALPDFAAPLEPMIAGWLWAPLWLALLALALRLRAAWVTHLAILDAVGWSMAAVVVEGGAWLLWGRNLLEQGGFSLAERDGVWQLMVGEIVFLFLTAVFFGPTSRQRIRFEQL